MQLNFNTKEVRENLTEADINQILEIVGHRARLKTKTRLESMLRYGRGAIPYYGIFNRLIKENDTWFYCAGQSYPDEIRTLSECILGKI